MQHFSAETPLKSRIILPPILPPIRNRRSFAGFWSRSVCCPLAHAAPLGLSSRPLYWRPLHADRIPGMHRAEDLRVALVPDPQADNVQQRRREHRGPELDPLPLAGRLPPDLS